MTVNLNFDRASDGICANSKDCADENPEGSVCGGVSLKPFSGSVPLTDIWHYSYY
jgi:hypothetical protein